MTKWQVELGRKASKAVPKLPKRIQDMLALLIRDIRIGGPVRGDWPNYSKLPNAHHCHLKKGKPTYVAVWQEKNGNILLVEVTYVGTHENAPY